MTRTILLADDNPTIRRLVTQTFADADFRVIEVSNGDLAIKTFEELRPDIVLADIYMPGKNGYEVCRHIRKHPQLGQTPVVLLVGAFEVFDEYAARQAGANGSITKPFEPGALIDIVKTTLSEHGRPEHERPSPSPDASPVHATPLPASSSAAPAAAAQSVAAVAVAGGVASADTDDLLGLHSIFLEEEPAPRIAGTITEDDIDRIAERVIQRISPRIIESIAWEIIPDMTEKIVREELKRVHEG